MKSKDIIQKIHTINRFRGAEKCTLLKGNESVENLLKLLSTRDGIDFAKQTKFPTMDLLRNEEVKRIAEKYGILIDKDNSLKNVPFLFLIGKGHSHIIYDSNQIPYTLILMHGHKATITATNGALVSLHDINSKFTIITKNLGKVIKL